MVKDRLLTKKRFGSCLLAGLLSFYGVFCLCHTANALVIQDASAVVLLQGAIATNHGSVTGTISGSDLVFTIPSTDTLVNGLWFKFNTTSGTAPNYLMTFNVRYQAVSGQSGYLQLDGLLGDNMDVITTSCVNTHNNAAFDGSVTVYQGSQTVTCTYLVLSHGNYDEFQSRQNSRIANFYQQVVGSSKIVLTPGTIRHFSTDGLTQSDRDWLESVMPTGSSTADIEEAIESSREEEKEEYEEQQDDVDSGADDAGSSAENATSSLIDNTRNIIETIRDTPATNCNIRIQKGNFDTGNLNLCNVPQTVRTVISTVIVIPVTLAALHIAYSTVMLYLNTVRKEQE